MQSSQSSPPPSPSLHHGGEVAWDQAGVRHAGSKDRVSNGCDARDGRVGEKGGGGKGGGGCGM